ncbi:hypothetical protein C8046_01035 [Serinibacter arcticus]|uniref:Excalibur calcium-binding domain-containing protein n=2 Tax=Serinibacter arcticus TaxID=1655435 RepID=A0A2U1ZR97_9MICO|nr:hypothetical protein C8046_01035 [Serinibacter arcticus]
MKRLGAILAAAIVGLTGAAVVAPAANAAIYSSGVFSIPYSGDLYNVNASSGEIRKLTFAEWQSLGSPAPRPAPTEFKKYAWSPTIYAVTFFGDQRSEWVWAKVTYDQWQRAGFPAPSTAGWIEGTYFYKWATSPELFAIAPDGVYKKLTASEWAQAQVGTFNNRSNEGFFKYSWDNTIIRMTNIAGGSGYGINYNQWAAEAFPTPQVVGRVPGDTVYQNYRDPNIWYAGPAFNRILTAAEWRAMGSPAPQVRTPNRPTDSRNCDSFGGSWRAAQDTFEYWFPLYGDVYGLDGNRDGIACNALRG